MTQSFNVYQAWSNAKIVLEVGGLGEVFGDSFMTLSPESAPIFPVHPIQDTKPPIIHIQEALLGLNLLYFGWEMWLATRAFFQEEKVEETGFDEQVWFENKFEKSGNLL